MARGYRPYFEDFCVHIVRFYLSRQMDPEPVPAEQLSEVSQANLNACKNAFKGFNETQKFLINECYSPLTAFSMFHSQLIGACEHLGITENAAFLELREALYRIAVYRGLIDEPFPHYQKLHERIQKELEREKLEKRLHSSQITGEIH